ncbi:MAG: hypothetical protein IT184_05080 [Acidobacteria bacterium]|nr:hypothetical protein [Acidobacteriota bacterium]
MRLARWPAWSTAALAAGAVAACVSQLPDQDLRIRTTAPSAKLSADLLWKEFQDNAGAARSAYFGKAVEVTGTVTKIGDDVPGQRYVVFGQSGGDRGVRANLLDETAGAILTSLPEHRRLTLRCYCEGLEGDVVLKSCVKP